MAKRKARAAKLSAPTTDYTSSQGEVLTLRGSLTAPSRAQYARLASGGDLAPAGTREDAWHRALEFLFERLAVRWSIAGEPIEHQGELLKRFRVASVEQRDWIRDALREHCAENFPDVEAP